MDALRLRRGMACALGAALAAEAAAAIPPFTEESEARGVQYFVSPGENQTFGRGIALADLDADGDLDLVLVGAPSGEIGVFANDGTGHFQTPATLSGVAPLPPASGVVAGDYDGDGDLDLFITAINESPVLYRNEGQFSFRDKTAEAGIGGDAGRDHGATFGDFNGDGYLDLYVCRWRPLESTVPAPNRLYRNNGDGTFTDVAEHMGVDLPAMSSFQAVWHDYDLDGDLDLLVGNDFGLESDCEKHNVLFENTGGAFVDVTFQAGVPSCTDTMGLAVGDFSGNGWFDHYSTNRPVGNVLYVNNGDGTYSNQTALYAVGDFATSWAALFFDFDNNSWLDLYVCNSDATPNPLYPGTGEPPYADLGAVLGVGDDGTSFTAAVGDLDGDGDQDLVVQNAGENTRVYINNAGTLGNSLRFNLVGTGPNRHAVGAMVDLALEDRTARAQVIQGIGYKSHSELTLHFGLGAKTSVDGLTATWPDGTVRPFASAPPQINTTWTLFHTDLLGDADLDGDFDDDDWSAFLACFGDGGGPVVPGCERFDFDGDWLLSAADKTTMEQLVGICTPDFNDDGSLSVLDFIAFQSAFQQGLPEADLDADGSLSVLDFIAFQQAFLAGCP